MPTPSFSRLRPVCAAAFALALLAALPALHAGDATDPFDPANKRTGGPAPAEKEKKLTPEEWLVKLVKLEAKFTPAQAKRGEVVKLTITGTPREGGYTYPLTKRAEKQGTGALSRVQYKKTEGLTPLWPVRESEPQFAWMVDLIGLEHTKPFTWEQDFLVDPKAAPGQRDVTVQVHLQACTKANCYGPADYPPFQAAFTVAEGPAATPPPEALARVQGPPPVTVVTPPEAVVAELTPANKKGEVAKGDAGTPPVVNPDAARLQNLGGLLWFAFVSAGLMLLTPCVFPMIPITVNFFIKQSEREHYRPLAMASVYSGTIIVLLTFVMLALGSVVIQWADSALFNFALGVVLIVFALSLFGMYEIELPHFLTRFTSAREGQGGTVGAVFMALTFTITSFTCTGPFLGLMLGSLAGVKPPTINLVLAALVYSATFAAPFFVLALFPGLLKKLPRSGGWLNAVKVTMGFLELGAALKFLANTDYTLHPGNPRLFSFDAVLAAWIALSVACSLYLLGFFRLPHDDQAEHIGVVRMVVGALFLGLAVYLTPALFGARPTGIVGESALAFLPPRLNKAGGGLNAGPGAPTSGDHLPWYNDYKDAWEQAVRENKPIFIDFTGVNCTNCRGNEENVFPQPEVVKEFQKFVRVQLYTDSVPNKALSAAQAKEQADRNMAWQQQLTGGDVARPYYVIVRPSTDAPFDEGRIKGDVLGMQSGTIFDVPAFVQLLQGGSKKGELQSASAR